VRHLRARHGLGLFQNLSSFSPIVGIFGHRQVGKTTFAEKQGKAYRTFDSKSVRESAEHNPEEFIADLRPMPAVIDECQMIPELFSELKEYVRTHKKPGQIILTGSVRFSSRRAIRESLTGRLASLELLPFCLTEILGLPRARLVLKLIQESRLSPLLEGELASQELKRRTGAIDDYLACGGMPGLFALRNPRLRAEKLRDQVDLILSRDLQLVHSTTLPAMQISEFVRELSQGELMPLRPSTLRKLTRVTEITQKKLLEALEAVFMVRPLPIEGYRRGISVIFEDQLERTYLLQEKTDPELAFEALVWRNMRASFNYETGLHWETFQFLEKAGRRRVPFAFRTSEGSLAVLPILDSTPSLETLRSAREFLARYNRSLALIVTRGQAGTGQAGTEIMDSRILKVPAERILFE